MHATFAAAFMAGLAALAAPSVARTITFTEPAVLAALDGGATAPTRGEIPGLAFVRSRYYADPAEAFDGFGIETFALSSGGEFLFGLISPAEDLRAVAFDYAVAPGETFQFEAIETFSESSAGVFTGTGSGSGSLTFDPRDSNVFFLFGTAGRTAPARISTLTLTGVAPIPLPAAGAALPAALLLLAAAGVARARRRKGGAAAC
jgi:hypothetical protein